MCHNLLRCIMVCAICVYWIIHYRMALCHISCDILMCYNMVSCVALCTTLYVMQYADIYCVYYII